jgi:hypothetical protein
MTMSDDVSASDGGGAAGWMIAAIIVAAIVLLLLFARGPEQQDRSGAWLPQAIALIAA